MTTVNLTGQTRDADGLMNGHFLLFMTAKKA